MISGLIAWGVHHQPELSFLATIIGIVAGLISIYKGIKGK